MHVKLLPISAIMAILSRVAYFYLVQGPHSPMYFLRLGYFKDCSQYVIIGLLLICVRVKQTGYCRLIINFGIWFCFSSAIYFLNVFLPLNIQANILLFAYPFFTIWGIMGVILFVYYFICLRGGLLE